MNRVHDTAIIEPGVVMGDDNYIGPYAVVYAGTVLGDSNWIGSHSVIGTPPEHRGFHAGALEGMAAGVVIRNRAVVHEFVSIQTGTGSPTTIEDGVMLMAHCSVGHDSVIRSGSTIGSGSNIAGHAVLDFKATLGLGVVVVQRAVVGAMAMVAMGTVVDKDVAPFAFVGGVPCRQIGLNEVGIARQSIGGCWQQHYWILLEGGQPDCDAIVPEIVQDAFEGWNARRAKQI